MIFTLIILCLFLLVVSYICSRQNIFSPMVLTASVWLVCIALFLILPHHLPVLTSQFCTAIALWLSVFALSSLTVQSCHFPDYKYSFSKTIRDFYFFASICCIPLLASFVYNALHFGTSGNWAWDLRAAALGYGENSSKTYYAPFYSCLWQVTYLFYVIDCDKKHWRRAAVMFCLVLGYAFATMSKTLILNVFVMTIFILYRRNIIKLKHILVGVLALFVGLFALQAIRQAMTINEGTANDTLVLYLLSSMSAFDTVTPFSSENFGENTLRIFYAVGYKIGLTSTEPINPILPFIDKPIYTNTYTTLYPFFKDFGYWGIGIGAAIIGALFGWIFKKQQSDSQAFVMIYAYFCTTLITQYNGESILTNFAGHTKIVLIICLPYIVGRYHLLDKRK